MLNINLRAGLLISSIIVFGFILFTVIKNKLNIKYSIVWILWALLTLLMSVFPESFYAVAGFLGIEMPVNAVFLIMATLLYGLVFYVYIMISKHNNEITDLTYEIADLKKKLEEKETKATKKKTK